MPSVSRAQHAAMAAAVLVKKKIAKARKEFLANTEAAILGQPLPYPPPKPKCPHCGKEIE